MGKLIDKLERMGKTEGPRLGFSASASSKPASMALVGVLPDVNQELAAAAVEGGADCLLVRRAGGKKSKASLAQALGVAESIPCGGEVAGSEGEDGAGWDFAVLEAADPLGPLLEAEDVDKALRLEADPPDSLLRALETLPIDAAILPEPAASLTLQALVPYYRVARATSKPILAYLPAAGEPPLSALRDAGIAGVLVGVENAAQAKALAQVRKAIDELPPKKAKAGRVRATPSLGLTAMPQPAEPHVEEEDEEED